MIQELRAKEFMGRWKRQEFAKPQDLVAHKTVKPKLHIVYVMTHVSVCGGVKIIFEHANHLKQLGAKVSIVAHFPKPTWFQLEVDYIQVPFHTELAHGIPVCDVIVATYWDHIQSCIETGLAPVVYFEQGDFHLFDYDRVAPDKLKFIHRQFELPAFIMTVSNQATSYIKKIYGRDAIVFHNALNENVFSTMGAKYQLDKPYLLMFGSEQTEFKGIPDIIKAHKIVKRNGFDVSLVWVTANEPTRFIDDADVIHVNPPQELIGQIYRGAACYVSGSYYEAFPLPGLEAMSCGCPVVTTANSGVKEYAVDQYNCLFSEIGNAEELATQIMKVLGDVDLADQLVKNGLKTADNYKWNKIIPKIYEYYIEVANHQINSSSGLEDWEITINDAQFKSEEDREKFYRLLLTTDSDQVDLPQLYTLKNGLVIARWVLAAQRRQKSGTPPLKFYLKVNANEDSRLPYHAALKYYELKYFQQALESFIALMNNEKDTKQKTVYFRWGILCLIELDVSKAKQHLAEMLEVTKDNADLYYLLSQIFHQESSNNQGILQLIDLMGEAVHYPEFIVLT
ncbi:glycosyltransferase family 4 protein [Paenibacillus sp. P26]|nr:glycosyltransferase family 4 protein [Paenibacillus sp. P26]